MKLAHPDMHMIIDIGENVMPVWVVENPALFREYAAELCGQAEGEIGRFVLSDNWEPVNIQQNVIVLTDLFHIDLNGRKQLTALNKQISDAASSERHCAETLTVKAALEAWFNNLEDEFSFAVAHQDPVDQTALLKAAGFHFETANTDLLGKLNDYIRICAEFLKNKLIICVGLSTCFSSTERAQLMKTASYEKLMLMDIESAVPADRNDFEKLYIIDRDFCEIYNDSDT